MRKCLVALRNQAASWPPSDPTYPRPSPSSLVSSFHRLPFFYDHLAIHNSNAFRATPKLRLNTNRSPKPTQASHDSNSHDRLARHFHSRRSLHPHPSTQPFLPRSPHKLRVYVRRNRDPESQEPRPLRRSRRGFGTDYSNPRVYPYSHSAA